jgi:hypothetical protein
MAAEKKKSAPFKYVIFLSSLIYMRLLKEISVKISYFSLSSRIFPLDWPESSAESWQH